VLFRSSYDLETAFDQEFDVPPASMEELESIRLSFLGEQEQVPPIYSAKQVNGKRAYEYAREGIELTLKPNFIKISSFDIDATNYPEITFIIKCSKGTYIRSLAHDFGQKAGIGGTLISLRRTKSGSFSIEEAKSMENWLEEMSI
jgi:tRNA pseudouridine55 synthase